MLPHEYAMALADAIENCRITCKHEPSAFDLEQAGYDTIITALRLYANRSDLGKLCDSLMAQRGEYQREARLGYALFEAALKWQNDPHAIRQLDEAIEAYRQYHV